MDRQNELVTRSYMLWRRSTSSFRSVIMRFSSSILASFSRITVFRLDSIAATIISYVFFMPSIITLTWLSSLSPFSFRFWISSTICLRTSISFKSIAVCRSRSKCSRSCLASASFSRSNRFNRSTSAPFSTLAESSDESSYPSSTPFNAIRRTD